MNPVRNFVPQGSENDISNGGTGIFITGTDTGAGKTVVTGLLGRYLLARGYKVITQKWIQTGSKRSPLDVGLHLKLMEVKRKDIKEYLAYMSPYTFGFAASPHLAASREGRKISAGKIRDSFKFLSERFDFVVAEGAGGALVPFNGRTLMIDIAKGLGLPVLIVADNKLGAINHTLLTIEAIKKRNMKIIGIVFNNRSARTDKIVLRDNPRIIKKLTGEPVLGVLPRLKNLNLLTPRGCKYVYKAFAPMGREILARLT